MLKGSHLVNWERVTMSCPLGGLGIDNLRSKNLALLSKWLWRFEISFVERRKS